MTSDVVFFFFKQKTAYEMRISDWSSDVCSSDLLAFASRDIFATVAALKQNGFRPLAISPNYYDDIEARFGLEPDLVDRLRAENILYDRDAAGEYFQIYSPNYGDGFFFEIIERRGYHGYGAPVTTRTEEHPSELQPLM